MLILVAKFDRIQWRVTCWPWYHPSHPPSHEDDDDENDDDKYNDGDDNGDNSGTPFVQTEIESCN